MSHSLVDPNTRLPHGSKRGNGRRRCKGLVARHLVSSKVVDRTWEVVFLGCRRSFISTNLCGPQATLCLEQHRQQPRHCAWKAMEEEGTFTTPVVHINEEGWGPDSR